MFGNNNEPLQITSKMKQEIDSTVSRINDLWQQYCSELGLEVSISENRIVSSEHKISEEDAKAFFTRKMEELKSRLPLGSDDLEAEEKALAEILPEAFAIVKAASTFLWNKPHYNEQLIGGILLNDGIVSQMATGEGKTLTATLPAYLNALLGKGVHVVTPNKYLAMRDQQEMGELYQFLGLSCGLVESRNDVSPERFQKKQLEIVQRELMSYVKEHAADPEHITPAERIQLMKKFFQDPVCVEILNKEKLRVRTYQELQAESIEKNRKAYQADITYGAADVFAFDYLHDGRAKTESGMVHREGKPRFAIIDEVDNILFDDARSPFLLSGHQDDEELAISDEEKSEMTKRIVAANRAAQKIHALNQLSNGELIYRVSSKREFEQIETDRSDAQKIGLANGVEWNFEDFPQEYLHALILDESTHQYILTLQGECILFLSFYESQIQSIVNNNRELLANWKDSDGNTILDLSEDQDISPAALAYIIGKNRIPELTKLFHQFQMKEEIEYHNEIQNAIKAWFCFQSGKDYFLKPENAQNPNSKLKVSLIDQNGRTSQGRIYGEGLQQAIELKEATLGDSNRIAMTNITDVLGSIPRGVFFSRYQKMGGMTGTSPVAAFHDLYGLTTYDVPRHKPKQTMDRGDRLYLSKKEKNEAIFEEIWESFQKGQPVLISTTSVEESKLLYAFLTKKFRQRGMNPNIGLLNAEKASDLPIEASIISKAGMPGAITIATAMAGRGTDIKLGGESLSWEEFLNETTDKVIADLAAKRRLPGMFKTLRLELWKKEQKERLLNTPGYIDQIKLHYKQRKGAKEKVLQAGGLKVIGSGHFPYSRVDDQVKGRCGRQGDPGEFIFFNDFEDLASLGIPEFQLEALRMHVDASPQKCLDTSDLSTKANKKQAKMLNAVIEEAQRRQDDATYSSIQYQQQISRSMSQLREKFHAETEHLRRSDEYVDAVETMIKRTVESILLRSNPNVVNNTHMPAEEKFELDRKQKISKRTLSFEQVASLSAEFLGISLTAEQLKQFKTMAQLQDYLTQIGLEKLHKQLDTQDKKGKERIKQRFKEVVDTCMNRAWSDFEGYIDAIEFQRKTNAIAKYQGGDADVEMDAKVFEVFAYCAESQRAMIAREILNPEFQGEKREQFVPVVVTPNGVEVMSEDYEEAEEEMEQTFDESEIHLTFVDKAIAKISAFVVKLRKLYRNNPYNYQSLHFDGDEKVRSI